MRIRGRETAAVTAAKSRRSGSARVWCSGGGRTSAGRQCRCCSQSCRVQLRQQAPSGQPQPVSVFSVCDLRRLRVWIYQKVTRSPRNFECSCAASPARQPVSAVFFCWRALKNSLRRMRGLQRLEVCQQWNYLLAGIVQRFCSFSTKVTHIFHAPSHCKSLGVPADADLHMYSRRRARAFINIYAFSLFRHQSVLSAWVRIPHLQLKNVVLRLKGWKPRWLISQTCFFHRFFTFCSPAQLLFISNQVSKRNICVCIHLKLQKFAFIFGLV